MEIIGIKEKINQVMPPGVIPGTAVKPDQKREEVRIPLSEFKKIISGGNEEEVKILTENINRFMKTMQYNLQFIVDKESGKVIIKVLDGKGNLIRRIPPEDMAGISAQIGESVGMVVNKTLE